MSTRPLGSIGSLTALVGLPYGRYVILSPSSKLKTCLRPIRGPRVATCNSLSYTLRPLTCPIPKVRPSYRATKGPIRATVRKELETKSPSDRTPGGRRLACQPSKDKIARFAACRKPLAFAKSCISSKITNGVCLDKRRPLALAPVAAKRIAAPLQTAPPSMEALRFAVRARRRVSTCVAS